ncbi:MAG: polysaccharide pyruvyl transferase family protein [Erysipelotrichaceae bacterium]|nr:polysaccharide pyruvyl transferase family protein [Erysipelotrichaceae bacterium]
MKDKIGIITFSEADDYGALLQSYGLCQYLRSEGYNADVICYAPSYLTGHYRFIPYYPYQSFKRTIYLGLKGFIKNLLIGKSLYRQKSRMRQFRKDYFGKNRQKLHTSKQASQLSYQYYIVGSDQIWNPEITYGLREMFFGAFDNPYKKKVIAYGASLGSYCLDKKYDDKFAKLISYVDDISLREADSIAYIESFNRQSMMVIDPVFLLDDQHWHHLAIATKQNNYILVIMTELNQNIYDYALKLSQQKNMPVIEIALRRKKSKAKHIYSLGPREVLGYIDNAAYVVTNSFHMLAFSIIFQKQFVVFMHSTRGNRLQNLLDLYSLNDRLYDDEMNIDETIDWDLVSAQREKIVKISKDFLANSLKGIE